jgi:S1-C subfamily serine protease
MRYGVIGIGAVLAAALVAAADEPRDARRVEQALQAAIARAEPAVACLYVYRPGRFRDSVGGIIPPDAVPDYYASGVVLESSGKILTNYHVIREAAGEGGDLAGVRIHVRLPAAKDADSADATPREGMAGIIAADAKSDLAVLKLDLRQGGLPTIPLGRGEDLKKGSFVVALGHPYAAGFRDGSPSASTGIVSNLRRRQPGPGSEGDRVKLPLSRFATMIQTDVRLQLGASGGALLDLDGKLVGLTTAAAALTGVDAPGGFAIPMDDVMRRIVEVMLRGEEVEYGFLGISSGPILDDGRMPGGGVLIGRVMDNSPARRAALMEGDVIVSVNGRSARDYDDFFLHLAATLAGRPARLVVRRGGREFAVDVPLVKGPAGDIDSTHHRPRDPHATIATVRPRDWHGLRVEYTSVLPGSDRVIPNGVLVREAERAAKAAGLVPYEDIITHVNDEMVNSPRQFQDAAEKATKRGESLKLTLAHGPNDSARTVALP